MSAADTFHNHEYDSKQYNKLSNSKEVDIGKEKNLKISEEWSSQTEIYWIAFISSNISFLKILYTLLLLIVGLKF